MATTAVAAALTAVLVLAPDLIGDDVPQANAEAALILHRAADAALLAPELQPRPDQFLYLDNGGGYERWYSVDGTRDGLAQGPSGRDVFPGCRNGQRATLKGDRVIGTEPCTPDPHTCPTYPRTRAPCCSTSTANLRLNLGTRTRSARASCSSLGIIICGRRRAAVFDAAAAVPGLSVVEHTTDSVGRAGVGIAWSTDGKSGMIVFDAETFAYLGFRQGDNAWAEVRVAIVDNVGQRP